MKIKRFKICVFVSLFMLLFCFMIGGLKSNAADYGNDDYNTSAFNTKFVPGNVEHWLYKFKAGLNPMSWGYTWDKTTVSYLRITDKKTGSFINNLTRIEAKYICNGKLKHVQKDIDLAYLDKPGIIDFGEDGKFTSYEYYWGTISVSTTVFKHDKLSKIFDDYRECNYIWQWKANVSKIMYMYVWYLDETGNEVASSFYDDGAHPKYDSNGKFLGIYNANDELMDGYGLSNDGLITSPDNMEIDLSKRQLVEEVGGDGSVPGEPSALEIIVAVVSAIAGIALVFLIFLCIYKFLTLLNKIKR